MELLLNASTQFPTVIFSTLLGILVVYWIIGLLGFIDLDLSPDTDLDIDVDLDIELDGYADITASAGGLTGLLLTFGLTRVPFTLVISIVVLVSWLFSIYLQIYVVNLLNDNWLYYVFGAASAVAIFFISLPITGFLIRPLNGMFDSVEATSSNTLVGAEGIVVTATITDKFGQVKVQNAGAEILIDARGDVGNTLGTGDKVLVIEYNKDSHSYIVAPFPDYLL